MNANNEHVDPVPKPLFSLGEIYVTPEAQETFLREDTLEQLLKLHVRLESRWIKYKEDERSNRDAVKSKGMILTPIDDPDLTRRKVWVITSHNHTNTTILLPSQY